MKITLGFISNEEISFSSSLMYFSSIKIGKVEGFIE